MVYHVTQQCKTHRWAVVVHSVFFPYPMTHGIDRRTRIAVLPRSAREQREGGCNTRARSRYRAIASSLVPWFTHRLSPFGTGATTEGAALFHCRPRVHAWPQYW